MSIICALSSFSVWGHAWNRLAKSEAEEKESRNRPWRPTVVVRRPSATPLTGLSTLLKRRVMRVSISEGRTVSRLKGVELCASKT